MNYEIVNNYESTYLLLAGAGKLLDAEADSLDLIGICASYDTSKILITSERLSADFLNLRTGVAGAILQKMTNYHIQTAIVVDESTVSDRFKEFILESKKNTAFRFFFTVNDAEQWLL